MPDLKVGDEMSLGADQLAVITGLKMDELPSGKVFPWMRGTFRITESTPHACRIQLIKLGADRGDDTAVQTQRTHDELAPFKRPMPPPGAGVDWTDTRPQLGPIELKVLMPGTMPGGGVVEKFDIFRQRERPELKSPHEHIMRSPQKPGAGTGLSGGEPSTQDIATGASIDLRTILAYMLRSSDHPTVRS
jgi:hypothetical protein